jgi:hypothetical protein
MLLILLTALAFSAPLAAAADEGGTEFRPADA